MVLRLETDYQAINPDGSLWILKYEGNAIENSGVKSEMEDGLSVVLDAGEDFEVLGAVYFKFSPQAGRNDWVAYVDWSTRKEKMSAE